MVMAMFVACYEPLTAQEALPVSVAPVVRSVIAEEINLTGDLKARRISMLSTEVAGIVEEILVDDGSTVNHGQLLLKLNTELASINHDSANAELAEADADLAEAERRFNELQQLREQNHAALTSVAAAKAQINIARAKRSRAASNLNRMAVLLAKHQIAAPFSGVIRRKLVEIGQWVDTSDPLVELVETARLRLEIPVPQYYFSKMNAKTAAQIRFDAFPKKVVESTVSAIIPINDTTSRTFRIRFDLDNANLALTPGMTAKVALSLRTDESVDSLIVPRDAIVRKPNGEQVVWIIEQLDGVTKVKPISVETGRTYRDGVELTSNNLSAGDLAVVRGNEILRPAQSVRVAEQITYQN